MANGENIQEEGDENSELRYESNPKHHDPWQPGSRGSLCDPDIRPLALALLRSSVLVGEKRFAVHEGKAYCAQEHRPGIWHGYPVGWMEVPYPIQRRWKAEQLVSKRQLKRFRESHE